MTKNFPSVESVKFINLFHINVSEKWKHTASYCEYYTLYFVKAGKLRLWTSYGHLEVRAGSVLFLEPGTRIRSGFSEDAGIEFFEVSFSASFLSLKPAAVFNIIDTVSVSLLFTLLSDSSAKDSLFYSLLCEITACASVSSEKDAILMERAYRYIDKNIARDFDFDGLAKHLGCDRSHISRVFSRVTGKTIKAYVNERRINMCCDLLALSSFDINKIASLMGFEESNLFTKFFTYHKGMTPSDYRRSVHGTKPVNG